MHCPFFSFRLNVKLKIFCQHVYFWRFYSLSISNLLYGLWGKRLSRGKKEIAHWCNGGLDQIHLNCVSRKFQANKVKWEKKPKFPVKKIELKKTSENLLETTSPIEGLNRWDFKSYRLDRNKIENAIGIWHCSTSNMATGQQIFFFIFFFQKRF